MRNMSFFLTQEQFKNKSKTVTRRNGWKFLKAGDVVQAVVKGQGIPKGGKVDRLGTIRIVDVRFEPLILIKEDDCVKEGFPEMKPKEFVEMYCKHNTAVPEQVVTRIEFEHLP